MGGCQALIELQRQVGCELASGALSEENYPGRRGTNRESVCVWGGGLGGVRIPLPRKAGPCGGQQQGEWKPQKQLPQQLLTSKPLCNGNFLKAGPHPFSSPWTHTGSATVRLCYHPSVFITARISYLWTGGFLLLYEYFSSSSHFWILVCVWGGIILAKWSLWPIYEKQSVIGITIVPT